MKKSGIIILVVAALVFASLGFVLGQVVQASIATPGSKDDPLVAYSGMEVYVGEKLADMQLKVDQLESIILAELPEYASMLGINGDVTNVDGENNTDNNNIDGAGSGTSENPDTTTTPPAVSTVRVTADTINVRADATTNSNSLGTVKANTVLTFLGEKNDSEGRAWYMVRLEDGTEGWVAGWYCTDPE